MTHRELTARIDHALRFIEKEQNGDGSFFSAAFSLRIRSGASSRKTGKNRGKMVQRQTTFFTSIIAGCIQSAEGIENAAIVPQAMDYLWRQFSQEMSVNYWDRTSPEYKKHPFPDDLDDTFCALATVARFDKKLLTGDKLARIVKLLTENETAEGGPYNTWIVGQKPPAHWKDVDVAVNANIGFFLSLIEIDLPNLTAFAETSIKKRQFESKYYHSPYSILYFISRFLAGGHEKSVHKTDVRKTDTCKTGPAKIIPEFLLARQQKNGSWGNELDTALAICTLLNTEGEATADGKLSQAVSKAVEWLAQSVGKNGYQVLPFYREFVTKTNTLYSGSPALTAAFCLEAFSRFNRTSHLNGGLRLSRFVQSTSATDTKETKNSSDVLIPRIVSLARRKISKSRQVAKLTALIASTAEKDRHIPLLPHLFSKTLKRELRDQVPQALIVELGAVNLFGWIAYTIYDDVIDGEGDDEVQKIPLANICLRQVIVQYEALFTTKRDKIFCQRILDGIDEANAWEMAHCRLTENPSCLSIFKNHQILADKSLGHALGPICILSKLGYDTDSSQSRAVLEFFTHYIIARQLNDDAHDWFADLEKSALTTVNIAVLAAWNSQRMRKNRSAQAKAPNKIKKRGNQLALLPPPLPPLAELLGHKEQLQEIFWYTVIAQIQADIFLHTKKARQALARTADILEPAALESLLVPLEHAAQTAIDESAKMREFIASYK